MDTHDTIETAETDPTVAADGAITGTATETTGEGEPAALPGDGPQEPAQAEDEPAVFPAEYVRKLRAEAAEARVKAKIADIANEHLLAAYAGADGRLADVEVLSLSPDLLGEDGLVDRDRVHAAIGDLLTAKPYLQSRKPTAPLPGQGLTASAPVELGWVDVLRGARG